MRPDPARERGDPAGRPAALGDELVFSGASPSGRANPSRAPEPLSEVQALEERAVSLSSVLALLEVGALAATRTQTPAVSYLTRVAALVIDELLAPAPELDPAAAVSVGEAAIAERERSSSGSRSRLAPWPQIGRSSRWQPISRPPPSPSKTLRMPASSTSMVSARLERIVWSGAGAPRDQGPRAFCTPVPRSGGAGGGAAPCRLSSRPGPLRRSSAPGHRAFSRRGPRPPVGEHLGAEVDDEVVPCEKRKAYDRTLALAGG